MRVLTLDNVEKVLKSGDSARLDLDVASRFAPGGTVLTRNFAPVGHTRLPRYARSKRGVVRIDHGVFIFPDTHAVDWEKKPQHLYAVEFTLRELWGEGASGRDTVLLDLFDDYLLRVDLEALPALPRNEEGPLFAEPWQAQAFALAVRLREQGHFTWGEWCAAMNEQILAAQAAGDPDLGDTYYEHWLKALEKLVIEKGLASATEIDARRDAWDRAHRATPHGEPVHLEAAVRGGGS